jgi:Fe(3+) dicitrate transport protein
MFQKNKLLFMLLIATHFYAEQAKAVSESVKELPTMDIVGNTDTNTNAQNLLGSGTFLSAEDLFDSHVVNVNEALRKVPGVFVRDEEGFGLRPNIGIRGMNPFRSTKVLFLEDGTA